MIVSSSSNDRAVVELSRSEVIALRNLLEYAPSMPLESRGPLDLFESLLAELQPLAASMGSD